MIYKKNRDTFYMSHSHDTHKYLAHPMPNATACHFFDYDEPNVRERCTCYFLSIALRSGAQISHDISILVPVALVLVWSHTVREERARESTLHRELSGEKTWLVRTLLAIAGVGDRKHIISRGL